MRQRRHAQETRRKMARVIDELYNALFLAGAKEVEMKAIRSEEGLRLQVVSDFDPDVRYHIEKIGKLLCPEERNIALVETYWELAGGDQFSSDSELSLVGHMLDAADVKVEETVVYMDLFLAYH